MGFSIVACVIAGVMLICYAVTLSDYSKLKQCQGKYFYSSSYWSYRSYDYCYNKYDMKRDTAANVAGLGSCLLIFSIVELFLALVASIYCCSAVCCDTPSVSCDVLNTSVVNACFLFRMHTVMDGDPAGKLTFLFTVIIGTYSCI